MCDDLSGSSPDGAAEFVDDVADRLELRLGGGGGCAGIEGDREVPDGAGGDVDDRLRLLLEAGSELVEIAAVGLDDGFGSGGYGFDEAAEGPGGRGGGIGIRIRVRVLGEIGGWGIGIGIRGILRIWVGFF